MTVLAKLITLFLIVVTTTISAQNFSGVATYKSHRKMDLKMGKEDQNSEMYKQIEAQLKKQFQREYTLTFNKEESIYKRVEELSRPTPAVSGMSIQINEGSDIMYINLKESRYVNKTEMMGKVFLIKDSLNNRKWELVNETKNIGQYTCFKAVFRDSITTQTITDDGGIEKIEKERVTSAWYTPQIPINNGPLRFQGLPGLILEINDGSLTLVCSKIVMNPEEQLKIEEPQKGKVVTQEKYDEIMEKKNEERMEMFRSRRGDGQSRIIRIGG